MGDKSEKSEPDEVPEKSESVEESEKKTVTCLGVSVPCEERESTECPSLSIAAEEMADIEEYISDKEVEVSTLPEFKIKQSIHDFKPTAHYWFVIRYNGETPEIRYIAPYADDVVQFFEAHYYIDHIGHASLLPLNEFVASYNPDTPATFVKYAGTFTTDADGRIEYWSNDSGHFESSEDYAAPVARALGIEDAVFIKLVREDMDQTIYYQQYKTYTGAYHANNVVGKVIGDEASSSIFYPHDYHTWYKHHGHQIESVADHTHMHSNHLPGFVYSPLLWIGILIAVVCCMIGFIVSFFVSKRGKTVKHMALKQDAL